MRPFRFEEKGKREVGDQRVIGQRSSVRGQPYHEAAEALSIYENIIRLRFDCRPLRGLRIFLTPVSWGSLRFTPGFMPSPASRVEHSFSALTCDFCF
jgi:hypothetical protein